MITVFGNRTPLTSQSSRIRRRVHSLVVVSLSPPASVASSPARSLGFGEALVTTRSGSPSAMLMMRWRNIYTRAARIPSRFCSSSSVESSAFTELFISSSGWPANFSITLSRTAIVTGDSSTDEPGPPLLGMVDAAIFLSSPIGLASLLQNTGHQGVKSRLIQQKVRIAKIDWKNRINNLFSV